MSAANMKKFRFAGTVFLAALAVGSAGIYAADAQNALPEPGPARKANIPVTAEKTLANGLRIVVATRRATPLVTTALYLRSGAEVDPPKLGAALDLLADVVLHPKFDQTEIERLRKQSLDNLQLELSEPQSLASIRMLEA